MISYSKDKFKNVFDFVGCNTYNSTVWKSIEQFEVCLFFAGSTHTSVQFFITLAGRNGEGVSLTEKW